MRNLYLVMVLGLAALGATLDFHHGLLALVPQQTRMARKTVVSIQGREFVVNGRPTYEGRSYDGTKVQGLLFNSRMVQGIFDDRNAETQQVELPGRSLGSRAEHA
jgi:hypothetical protein